MPKRPMIDTMINKKYDNLYTPENVILPLLKYLPKDKKIWECTDYGNSKITTVLKNRGYNVIGSDITTGFDFLKDDPDFDFDMIITNPPYSLKNQFLEKCYEYDKPFALLLPLTALEGIARGDMFRKCGISVIVLDKRADFTGKGANWFNTSWFCWGFVENHRLFFENIV